MGKIHLLDKTVYELIAAGQVIDKPFSAVKELIENSIDADAKNIVVEIKNGGRTYIRVTDNGSGIAAEDVPLAFVNHATSKVVTLEDIESIYTLGFRGEALASISAMSNVQLLTKRREDELGFRYEIEGGVELSSESAGCPDGTTVVVRNLFYNTPARQKYMYRDVSEGNAIASTVQKMALSHPEISFKFIRDNKIEFVTSGDGELPSAIYTVLGKNFYDSCIPVDYKFMYVTVKGYVTKPLASRASRTYQNFYVNSRYVKKVLLATALEEAYANRIMSGKKPGCVLNISLPSNVIDINVQPNKLDVRFRDDDTIFTAISSAANDALLKFDSPEEINADGSRISANSSVTHRQLYTGVTTTSDRYDQLSFGTSSSVRRQSTAYTSDLANILMKDYIPPYKSKQNDDEVATPTENNDENNCVEESEPENKYTYISEQSFAKPVQPETVSADEDVSPEIRVIGEAFKTYILAECGDDILLVDKHAAHERYIFEGLKRNVTTLDSQMLLNPAHATLTYEQYDALHDNQDTCKRLGVLVQFGVPPMVVIIGSPMIAQDMDPIDLAVQIADCIIEGKKNKGKDIFDDLYHTFACKAAIKANSDTNIVELEYLMKLITEEDIRYCPHGRPVLVKLSKREIEKMFRRIV